MIDSSKKNPFKVDFTDTGIATNFVQSSKIIIFGQIIKAIATIFSTAFLARILSAEDFGIIAICTSVTAILARLKDGGLSTAVIQTQSISIQEASNIFWINAAIGFSLMFFCVLISPSMAFMYSEPKLASVLIFLSTAYIFGGFGVQFDALLRRRLDYTLIMIIEILTVTFAIIIACYMALTGFGYWALVALSILPVAGHLTLAAYASKWRPLFYSRKTNILYLLKFGGISLFASILATLTVSLVALVVGLIDGINGAGIYSRAIMIVGIFSAMFLIPISHLTQSSLSRFHGKSSKDSFDRLALSALQAISIMAILTCMIFILFSDLLATIILGEGWTEVGSLIKLLAPIAIVEPVIYLLACQLTAKGMPDIVLKLRIIDFIVVSFLIAMSFSFGIIPMIITYATGSACLRLPLFIFISFQRLNLDFKKLISCFLFPLFCAFLVTSVFLTFQNIVESYNGFIWQIFFLLLAFSLYGLLLLFNSQIRIWIFGLLRANNKLI
ncbi:polysaccharide biosynthesis protein [SAR86 cluster bacterium SAR86E]|uniref:Polysaccharide biosynthesis protein n=1 Tax=SAR86 cluster bacterium SAR86E TaxID=1208365 RepID=K6GGR8_9GAMM|nr:polysaccharide biosynthesis protein [SAR86 cluster bacterium SAR86E]